MGNMSGRVRTRGAELQQEDTLEGRQRVATYVDGNSVAYEGTLTTGADVECNFFNDSAYGGAFSHRRAHYGYLICDGPGDLQVYWSADGVTMGGIHTVKYGEQLSFDSFSVYQLYLRWITDAKYRVLLM